MAESRPSWATLKNLAELNQSQHFKTDGPRGPAVRPSQDGKAQIQVRSADLGQHQCRPVNDFLIPMKTSHYIVTVIDCFTKTVGMVTTG